MTDKSLLRAAFKHIRNSLKDRESPSEKIVGKVLESQAYLECDTVYAYFPVGSEVRILRIIEQALHDDKNVTLPKCLDKKGTMEFYYINSLSDVSEGTYGIPEPTGINPAGYGREKSLCLVPGLAYDREGYRLGYGGGYYDRFLSKFKGISIGLCYDACIADCLPHEETDRQVDIIITESKHMKIKEE